MNQISLAHTGFELSIKRTRKREFLDEMNLVIPWAEVLGLLRRHAPESRMGRPPFALETMLRIHLLQQFFGLSDPAMEEALHDVPLYREFARLDAGKAEALAQKGATLLTPIKAKPGRKLHPLEKQANRLIAGPRSKVEHLFRIVKCQFGYRKTRFRGLVKNIAQLKTLFGLANLYLLRKKLMQPMPQNCAQGT